MKKAIAAEPVLAYKSLGKGERVFWTMEASDLEIPSIHHRLECRVRAHPLICTLAFHVEMRMRNTLIPNAV